MCSRKCEASANAAVTQGTVGKSMSPQGNKKAADNGLQMSNKGKKFTRHPSKSKKSVLSGKFEFIKKSLVSKSKILAMIVERILPKANKSKLQRTIYIDIQMFMSK